MIDDCANNDLGRERRIRTAAPEDADLLLRVIDYASDGVLPAIWAGFAPEGVDPMEVGRGSVLADEGPFSWRSAWIGESGGQPLGGMIGYVLPDPSAPPDPETPEMFLPVEKLMAEVPGYWLINMIAVLPEARGARLGAALMAEAEAQARKAGAPGVALIVAASNEGAVRFYQREGFGESGRCPLDAREFGREATEAVLMVKAV